MFWLSAIHPGAYAPGSCAFDFCVVALLPQPLDFVLVEHVVATDKGEALRKGLGYQYQMIVCVSSKSCI